MRDCKFHSKKESYNVSFSDLFLNISQSLRVLKIFLKFKWEYRLFRKDCEVMSQKEAISKRKTMNALLEKEAEDFLKENKLHFIHKKYFSQYGNSIGFKNPHRSKLLGGFIGGNLLLSSPKEFIFQKERLVAGFKDTIVKDTITKISKTKKGFTLVGRNKKYSCKNLIVATPIWVSNKLLSLGLKLNIINVDMVHVKGEVKKGFEKRFNLFDPQEVVSVIARQSNGSYLVFYEGKLDLEKYFSRYKVITKKTFRPAFTSVREFLEARLAENLFLIGDYNISSVEDSYITGIYAANQIIKKEKN